MWDAHHNLRSPKITTAFVYNVNGARKSIIQISSVYPLNNTWTASGWVRRVQEKQQQHLRFIRRVEISYWPINTFWVDVWLEGDFSARPQRQTRWNLYDRLWLSSEEHNANNAINYSCMHLLIGLDSHSKYTKRAYPKIVYVYLWVELYTSSLKNDTCIVFTLQCFVS